MSFRIFKIILLIAGTIGLPTCADANPYDTIISKQVEPNGPGIAVIIKQGDKVIYKGAKGLANIELKVPLKPDSVFRLGSITKQFTAAAIMKLEEQGKLSLNLPKSRCFLKPVSKWLIRTPVMFC